MTYVARLSIRNPSGDYAGPGDWFITISAISSLWLFGQVDNERVVLSTTGRIVHDCWRAIPDHFPHVVPDRFVVMPSHLHGILALRNRMSDSAEAFGKPVAGSVATIVRSFKSASTLEARRACGEPFVLWQRGFHDRRLGGDRSLSAARRYIEDNPAEWERTHAGRYGCIESLVTAVVGPARGR